MGMPRAAATTAQPVDAVAHRRRQHLPAFALYGEAAAPNLLLLHIEPIHSRSRLYNWEIDAHVHQGLHQVLWLQSGQVTAMLDETSIQAEGPTALVIPPGVAHAFRFSPGCEGFVLTLNAGLLAEGDEWNVAQALQAVFATPRALPLAAHPDDAQRLQALLATLHGESQAAHHDGGPVALWLARAVVWRLAQLERQAGARPSGARASGRQSLYTRWVVLVEAHHREHWPVSRYAQRLGLSAERLNRMVRAETGLNAQAVLHERLVREACRHLLHVAAPVSKLAFELGFEDPAYFCRFFKRHTGLSPRAFRAQGAQQAAAVNG